MQPRLALLASLVLSCLAAAAVRPAQAECDGFKWDVSKERALFATSPADAPAAKDRKSASAVTTGRLYALHLLSEDQVTFAQPPGKTPPDGSYAGLAAFTPSVPGTYRFSLEVPLWIDVVENGKLLRPRDYEGQRDCSAPHKIVVFDLDGNEPLMLQFSGSSQPVVRFTITQTSSG